MKPSARRVLTALQAANGGWVRGRELAEVGGFRFGGRIFELRGMGHRIEKRSDPRSAVAQYRILLPDEQLTLESVPA